MGGGGVSSSGGGEMAERDVGPTMASLQHQPLPLSQNLSSRPCSSATNSCSNNARGTNLAKLDSPDEFPAGMRVLVVDDDPICLMVLERMLHQCNYRVTTCGKATDALSLLREDINKFDLVISDVYMPDMDGFKLLELVGLEMDLPVIMMSGNGETSAVMKGITHGACDYLLKPVRIEELRNIWQHVVRKKRQDVRIVSQTKSVEEGVASERQKRGAAEDAEYTSSANDTNDGNWKKNGNKRKGEFKEENEQEDVDQENDDPSTMKKPRVVWSVELHQQFVSAVNQLGIDKAVPKRILELMGVHGLTRENVASHLQKYRLYLKRLSGVSNQQSGMNAHFGGGDPFGMMPPDLGVNMGNGQLTPQQFHLLGRMNPSNGMGFSGGLDPVLNQMFLQDLSRPPQLNGILKGNGGLLSSLPAGLPHLEQLSEAHHLPVVSDLEDYSSNTKVFPHGQLNGNMDVSIASLGVGNGGLGANPNSDTLLMHMYPRGGQQGGGPASNLGQGRGGLATSHLLGSDVNFGPVGGMANLGGNLGSAVGLSALTGSGGGRDLSPSVGGAGSSLPSPLGSLVRRPLMGDEASSLVNSTSGGFSLAPSVQSPKHGAGGGGAHGVVNEGLEQQQSMWAMNYPVAQLSHGQSQGLSHDSVPWSGLAENLGLGEIGQSLSAGLSSQYSPHGGDHGIGFAAPSRGSYGRQSLGFPGSSGLDGRMVRSSYES